jgi:hypothetical protein
LLPNDQIAFASVKFRVAFGPDEQLSVPAAEHTQHLDAEELAALLAKAGTVKNDPSSFEMPVLPAQNNPLPDVYPDDGKVQSAS